MNKIYFGSVYKIYYIIKKSFLKELYNKNYFFGFFIMIFENLSYYTFHFYIYKNNYKYHKISLMLLNLVAFFN